MPDPAAWSFDGSSPIDYSHRLRVSRSADGKKIFYTWTDIDTTNVIPNSFGSLSYHPNSRPNLEYKGYDVTTNMFTEQFEMPASATPDSGYYLHYVSSIVMPTDSGYRIPAVYSSMPLSLPMHYFALNYNYINDMEINNSSYTQVIQENISPYFSGNISIKSIKQNKINVSQNFPNPFNTSSTVKVNLNKAENITLSVMNSIGQVVSTQTVKGTTGTNELTIDAANLTNGVYFYSVIAGNSKVTRKMTIVK